ncbi:MAG: DUF6293 family protein, partial [Atribacterota bacterium]|nr:DUF6293 family protein [Atribacterota bacterium]
MTNGIAEIVHIIPLGHEYDRAIRPFDSAIANRVYLIVDTGDGSSSGQSKRDQSMNGIQKRNYTPRVKAYLEGKNIDVRVVETLTFDLESLLTTMTSIIRLEQEVGSQILINMSSSGRLGAVGASIAGMVYGVPTYYVHSDYFSKDSAREMHGLSVCDTNHVSFLPDFKFTSPNSTEALVLKVLYDTKKKASVVNTISSKEIVAYLEMHGADGFVTKDEEMKNDKRVIESRKLMRLSTILKKLSDDDKYIIGEKSGRKMLYYITD